jgi:hypothetical protein
MKRLEVIGLHHKFFSDFEFDFHSTHLLYHKNFPHGQQVIFVHYTEIRSMQFSNTALE